MTREIKFRAWDKKYQTMTSFEIMMSCRRFAISGELDPSQFIVLPYHENIVLMQYTGFKDSKGVECYEGDIKREEIEEDDGDRTFYYVCVWVQEWAMFCWICITDGEYQKYLDEGAESLDETMFWTYAFNPEDIANARICGNIYQNPELLNP